MGSLVEPTPIVSDGYRSIRSCASLIRGRWTCDSGFESFMRRRGLGVSQSRPAQTPLRSAPYLGGLAAMGVLICALTPPSQAKAAVEPPPPLAGGLLAVYEQNRQHGTPNYITEDLLLLSYSMIRVDVSRTRERERSLPRFQELIGALEQAVAAAENGEAAVANRDFVAVLRALLDGATEATGAGRAERAQAELDLALAAPGIVPSPLWGRRMDYSQFRPRGYYAADERLARYFRAVRYAGAALFPVQASKATGVDRRGARRASQQARALADLIEDDTRLAALYRELLAELTWEYGPPDDLTGAGLRAVAPEPVDTIGARLLAYARDNDGQPRIIGDVVDRSKLEPGVSLADALTGWRLLPQRRTADSEAFQALVFDSTGKYVAPDEGDEDVGSARRSTPPTLTMIDGEPVKGFPLLAELMCMWGSISSCQNIHAQHEDRFEGYAEATSRARRALASAQGLAALHRSMLVLSLRSDAEHAADRLIALRAFWTWQRYTAALHAKQSYTPTGKGIHADPPRRPGARVQSSIGLYLGLARVVEGHRRFTPHRSWDAFAGLLDQVIDVAARDDLLTAEDETFLNNLDGDLKALAGGTDAPVIVDVHTNPARGEALYEATGFARVVDGRNRPWGAAATARGARLSQCEFFGPIVPRLTDAEWRERLLQMLPAEGGPFLLGRPCPDAGEEA